MQTQTQSIDERLTRLNCCVLLPTYNNGGTLRKVLKGVLEMTRHIIVVNDGATDDTRNILEDFPVHQVHLAKNKGKGNALKVGFAEALSRGFDFAITMDTDGQHFAGDIPVFVAALEQDAKRQTLFIGARNMRQSDVPGKSSFGNRFSNFWFWFETGIWLQDTQCGFRLYPLREIEGLSLRTPKFEFEIEVIVKAAWKGLPVKNVPVRISYDAEERVSHFRTVPDFARISVLNTWFVLVTLFYIKPRNLYRRIKQKGLRKFMLDEVLGHQDSPRKKSLSIALGTLIGLSPFWGLHTFLVLFLAVLLGLNKAVAFAFSNVSLPPFIPLIVYLGVQTGIWITGEELTFSFDSLPENLELLTHFKVYIIGSLAFAVVAALLLGGIGFLLLTYLEKRKMAVGNG